jgi:hypothetical protein
MCIIHAYLWWLIYQALFDVLLASKATIGLLQPSFYCIWPMYICVCGLLYIQSVLRCFVSFTSFHRASSALLFVCVCDHCISLVLYSISWSRMLHSSRILPLFLGKDCAPLWVWQRVHCHCGIDGSGIRSGKFPLHLRTAEHSSLYAS